MHFSSTGPFWCVVIVTETAVSQLGGFLVGFGDYFCMEFFHGFRMACHGVLIRNGELAPLDSS
jgi:hypothetical protein